MGNKKIAMRERCNIDPRTKKRRRKQTSKAPTCSQSNLASPPPPPPTTNSEENTATSLSCAGPSSFSLEASSLPPATPLDSTEGVITASEKKIRQSEGQPSTSNVNDVVDDGHQPAYIFMDTGILSSLLDELIKCTRCGFNVETTLLTENKQGLCHYINIDCRNISCRWSKCFSTSKEVERDGRGAKPFDINLRAILAFREIGRGHASIETFCGYMNMPPPMTEATFNNTISTMYPAYVEVAAIEMKESAISLRKQTVEHYEEDIICDTAVSCDGTWQRRGYSSLNGVVNAISIDTGKCLAYETLVKNCKSCEMWFSRKGTLDYENFIKTHDCPINHEGSAGSMEPSGILRMFEKSVENLKLRFTTYIGDGDSKAYSCVATAAPYGQDKPIIKGECVGHVQKRVGGRLRKFKKENGSELLSDGKKLGGVGRLHDKWINKLQNYYGLAIRQNTHSLISMRMAVGAVLYHCSEATTTEARHMFCDKDSQWCKMRQAEKLGVPYSDKPGLPIAVRDKIKPIFQALSTPELLAKCLHGKTQNCNEALNGFIWKRLPKDVFVGPYVLEMGVCSAILNFNSGTHSMIKIFDKLGMTCGFYTNVFCMKQDEKRIVKMSRKMSVGGKLDRKRKRSIKKGYEVRNEDKEGEVYESGLF